MNWNRDDIADELLLECVDDAIADHLTVANAVRRGDDLPSLLAMPEVDRWPETYMWLALVLKDERTELSGVRPIPSSDGFSEALDAPTRNLPRVVTASNRMRGVL